MGRLTCLKSRAPAPRDRFAETGAVVGHERQVTGSKWRTLRRETLTRDCGMCVLCLREGRFELASDVDHVVPIWEGGTDAADNRQSLCKPCHKAKTAAEAARRART